MKLYLCEKPSQAADVAKALGQARKTPTHWETAGGRVTWAFGHLLESADPETYDPAWKVWNFGTLPMIPEAFSYLPRRGVGERIREIGRLLKDSSGVVIATDAGREGEVIARELLEHLRWRGPVERLWMSATDPESVRKALADIRPGRSTEPLFAAGRARAEADWIVGLNMTRAMTLLAGGRSVTSVGRVQTPTLALVVRRDRERASFKPVKYFDVAAASATGLTLVHAPEEAKRITDRSAADSIVAGLVGKDAPLTVKTEPKAKAPPLPFDLSSLQSECDRRFGWTAKHTLAVAQALYEEHKATTYPRTECRYLPEEQLGDVPALFANATALTPFAHLAGQRPAPRKSIYNTSKVEEHHGIIPTNTTVNLAALPEDARQCYILIVGQFLAGLLPDYQYLATEVAAEIDGRRFVARGVQPTAMGWREVFAKVQNTEKRDADDANEDEDGAALPQVRDGDRFRVASARTLERVTKAPPAYTEARLIEDMKTVAKFVSDPKQKARLRETSGLGTAATRAEIVETLKHHEYLLRKGRVLTATPKAHTLIDRLEREMPALADVGESALWEDALADVAKGQKPASEFLRGIKERVRGYVDGLRAEAPAAAAPAPAAPKATVGGVELSDHGEYWTTPSVKGRIYKTFFGHAFTPEEIAAMLGGKRIELFDCKSKTGSELGPKTVVFNRKRSPFPGVEFYDGEAAGAKPVRKRLLGFSAIELLVVIAVIAVLSAIFIPVGRGLYLDSQTRYIYTAMKNVETFSRAYISRVGSLPVTTVWDSANFFVEGTSLSTPRALTSYATVQGHMSRTMDWRHVLIASGVAQPSDLVWVSPQKITILNTLAGTAASVTLPRTYVWMPGTPPAETAYVPLFADNAAQFGVQPAALATFTPGSAWFVRPSHPNLSAATESGGIGTTDIAITDDAPFRAHIVNASGNAFPRHFAGRNILRQTIILHPSQLLTRVVKAAKSEGYALVLHNSYTSAGLADTEILNMADNLTLPTTLYASPGADQLNATIAGISRIAEVSMISGSVNDQQMVRLDYLTSF